MRIVAFLEHVWGSTGKYEVFGYETKNAAFNCQKRKRRFICASCSLDMTSARILQQLTLEMIVNRGQFDRPFRNCLLSDLRSDWCFTTLMQ